MSVSWGGRTERKCQPSRKTCPQEGARFLGGSPVVLRRLCCHVCCDSALQFLKTFCWIECNPPSFFFFFLAFFPLAFLLSRLLVERFGKKKKQLASGKKNNVLCVRVWRFATFRLSDVLIWSKCCRFSLLNGQQTVLSTQYELGTFTCVTSFNPQDNPGYCIPHFLRRGKRDAERLNNLSQPGFEPRVFSVVQGLLK